jgi:hypothetical protein
LKFETTGELLVFLSNLPRDTPIKSVGWCDPKTLLPDPQPCYGVATLQGVYLCAEDYSPDNFVPLSSTKGDEPDESIVETESAILPSRSEPRRTNVPKLQELIG